MKLIFYPNDKLLTPCEPVKRVDGDLQKIAKEMHQFMLENKGVGLSANQIGRNEQLLVADNNGKPLYMFNPRIMSKSSPKYVNEGCLSLPGELVKKKRETEILVKYMTINNQIKMEKFKNFTAQIILHEIDHLRGVDFREDL